MQSLRRNIIQSKPYLRYKGGRFINDIAILHLDRTIDLVSYNGINAACIPPKCRSSSGRVSGMFDYKFSNGTGVR